MRCGVTSKKWMIVLVAALAPMPAFAQVRLEAQAYARARAQCGYNFQEQARLRCPNGESSCTAPLLTQQQQCIHRAEQSYHRALQRLLRDRY